MSGELRAYLDGIPVGVFTQDAKGPPAFHAHHAHHQAGAGMAGGSPRQRSTVPADGVGTRAAGG